MLPALWEHYARMKDGKVLTKRGGRFAAGSRSSFHTAIAWLSKFESSRQQTLVTTDLTEVSDEFITYLTFRTTLSLNSVHQVTKKLSILFSHLKFEFVGFKVSEEEVDTVYLDNGEIDQLTSLAPKNSTQKQVLIAFLLGCKTGFRFSDLRRVLKAPDKFIAEKNGTVVIRLYQVKGNAGGVIVPISKERADQVRSLNYKLRTNQSFNKTLHLICREAGLTSKVTISKTRNGLREERVFEKWELITSHTARRTFATLAFLAGIPVLRIMKITGHKTEAAFMRYIRISREENAVALAQHPFFK